MRSRKIILTLCACVALGAFATSAAQAAQGWTIGTTENQGFGGTLIASGTHERISCKKHGTSSLVFTSTLLGTAVELTAEGVDCLEKAGSTNAATIDNTTKANHSEGVLTFTGVKVVKPANCSVAGGELTTSQLTDEVIMDSTSGSTVVYDKFFPEVAANGFLRIEFQGALCPLSESSATVKGSACGESVHTNGGGTGYESNLTGTLTKVQTLLFGSAQQTTGGCSLTFGAAAAQFTGAVDTELSGTNAGKPFGAIGGAAEPQNVAFNRVAGTCVVEAGKAKFTTLGDTCEYELVNNNLLEPIQVTKRLLSQPEGGCETAFFNCLVYVAPAGGEECVPPGFIEPATIVAKGGGKCFVKLKYSSEPSSKPVQPTLEIETSSLPGGAIKRFVEGQVIKI